MKFLLLPALLALGASSFGQAPVIPLQPEIILPSKEKKDKKLDDSRVLAAQKMPLSLNGLGLLASDLLAYFPMDDTSRGCLAWSRKPISVRASGNVRIKEADGLTYADFSEQPARLVFDPPLEFGARFTLTAWIQAPAPHGSGCIWHGHGALLFLKEKSLGFWHKKTNAGGDYAKTAAPLKGWMHVAVTCDGTKTQAFLNGTPLDVIPGIVSNNVQAIGNHPSSQHQHWMMADGIDEQYFFSRSLTVDEIKKVMTFSAPKK